MIKYYSVFFFLFLSSISLSQENRTIDGQRNNPIEPTWGSTDVPLERKTSINYLDDVQEINDVDLPTPRQISNQLFEQNTDFLEAKSLSDYVWLFGQFLDHDISLIENGDETTILEIPTDDNYFSPQTIIPLSRSEHMPGTGQGVGNPRMYQNKVTSFIDGSNVYGSTTERANWLRSFEDGKLKVSKNSVLNEEVLPWNTVTGEFNDQIDLSAAATMADDTRSLNKYFVAGDDRANENTLLLCMHILFVREHNRLCDELKKRYPSWNDEKLYQRARKMVGAYLQSITYNEWLPSLGVYLPEYQGYTANVEPSIMNVFSAAAFRIGHTMIDDDIIRMNNEGEIIPAGNLSLKDAFFQPRQILEAHGIDPYFKGMGTQVMQEMDCKMIGDLRNFLFQGPSNTGLDLASINIFRGRDRGLPDYNTLRKDFGLAKLNSFSDMTDNAEDIAVLSDLYGSVDKIDAWVGMLTERHIDESAVFGELVMTIIKDQFRNLRDCDRFYFENDKTFSPSEIATIKRTTLHDIIMRNTSITLMQPNVFEAMPHMDIPNLVIEQIALEALVYPNPIDTRTTVKIYSDKEIRSSYQLIGENGQVLQSGTIDLYTGQDNYLELFFDATYSKGHYSLLLETEEGYTILKLIKQ